jgi:Ca2+-transporting ATPase
VLHTLRYSNPLIPLIIGITVILSATFIYWQPVALFFGFTPLNLTEAGTALLLGFASVIWYEGIKK